MQPPKGWTPKNIETMARYLAENYYLDEDGNQQARRSDEDAYEEWKTTAASLGVSRTGSMEYPDEVTKRAEAIRREMGRDATLAAAAPRMARMLYDIATGGGRLTDDQQADILKRLQEMGAVDETGGYTLK